VSESEGESVFVRVYVVHMLANSTASFVLAAIQLLQSLVYNTEEKLSYCACSPILGSSACV
jgi:hypothetical protein